MFCLTGRVPGYHHWTRFLRLAVALLSPILSAFTADLPKVQEKPVGIVLAADGTVLIDTHQSETSWTAAPGILLFSGYSLRNVRGSIRFSFCLGNSEFTLAPGAAVTLRSGQIDGSGTQLAGQPSFCQIPVVSNPTEIATRGEEPPDEPLTPERGTDLALRLKPVEAGLAANPRDVSAHLARIAVLQEFGRVADKDAELFAQLLLTPRADGRNAADEVHLLTNQRATRAAIENEVEELAKENAASPKSNTLVLYVAGHGAYPETEMDPSTHKPL
jgi:hypothetical protein